MPGNRRRHHLRLSSTHETAGARIPGESQEWSVQGTISSVIGDEAIRISFYRQHAQRRVPEDPRSAWSVSSVPSVQVTQHPGRLESEKLGR